MATLDVIACHHGDSGISAGAVVVVSAVSATVVVTSVVVALVSVVPAETLVYATAVHLHSKLTYLFLSL